MSRMTILTEAELRKIVTLDLDAVACVENAFRALVTMPVAMPPILRLDIHEHRGEVDVKSAYVPGIDGFAVKISSGFFDNPKLGLPSGGGMMVLLSAKTGVVEAQRFQLQAGLQLEALRLVRPIAEARVWARDAAKAEATAARLRERLGIMVRAEPDAARAAAGADIIVTTTPSTEPLIRAGFVSAGQHITAMGSDAEHKNEIAPAILRLADLYVADSAKQTRRLGELHHAIEAGAMAADAEVTELGQVIAGKKHGRRSAGDITIADLTGTGVQDTAIATLARDRAGAAKTGTIFES
ncbi:ornithine cyclodeaminase family protein [Mesorhizobium sp. M1A.F.Ca.ET.072.01.1.1]|uniref:ornithine cyclodeaminase family protein n=1 Tax=Mesorhizobium sp. M1A.F.Ca.ET.072.01.1.1 TaxID=2496753 RepID=UPI000FD5DB57|nr:ornithine cyclodeaminase family protein [Mesorhizobium sp. M1A.F.Ca.ET.072.01.1.1]RUW53887.1 ornithine cyclodeaminase family protein [Mesorhizobium sp. M1A.F.Ca.ET.072.01.1.1]